MHKANTSAVQEQPAHTNPPTNNHLIAAQEPYEKASLKRKCMRIFPKVVTRMETDQKKGQED